MIQRQRPIAGGRERVNAAIIAQTERAIRHTMRRFQVSRSFVIAVALADYFGIEEQEQFTRKRRDQ